MAIASNPYTFELALKLSFFNKQGKARYAAMAISGDEFLRDFVQALRGMADKLEEEL